MDSGDTYIRARGRMVYDHKKARFIKYLFRAQLLEAIHDDGARPVLAEAKIDVEDRYIAGLQVDVYLK